MEVLLSVQILHCEEQERQQLSLGTQTETCLHTLCQDLCLLSTRGPDAQLVFQHCSWFWQCLFTAFLGGRREPQEAL